MIGGIRFRRVSIPAVLLLCGSMLAWAPAAVAAGGPGQPCIDCHKEGPRSQGADPNRSGLVHIGGVSPHRGAAAQGASPGTGGGTNPSTRAPKR